MAPELTEARARLRAADARIDAADPARRTLAPGRRRATSFAALGDALLPRAAAVGATDAFARGLAALGDAILAHFPENLLWDLDAMAAALVDEASSADALEAGFRDLVELHALFGRATPIRFRYVHDFAYGFDWAKWVRRDPPARAAIGPFDRAFRRSMLRRGHELLALIEADDAKYPRLRDEGPRNPFGFSREPEDELALYRDLAARDLVPVRTWELRPRPVWDRPYAAERDRRAEALALAKPPAATGARR